MFENALSDLLNVFNHDDFDSIFYYKIYDANFHHEINSIGHKQKKVVEKEILFGKLTDFLLFFNQENFDFKKSSQYF